MYMFFTPLINCWTIFYNMFLIAVTQEIKSIDISVVVTELDLAIKRDLWGLLWSLGYFCETHL